MSQHAKVIDTETYVTNEGCRVSGYSILHRMGDGIVQTLQHITLEGPQPKVVPIRRKQ